MKILHTSDFHLGKRLNNSFDRTEEMNAVLEEIYAIAESEAVDIVLIAGDLFDNFNPSNDSMQLLYNFCLRLVENRNRLVIAIAGNHDSPERVELPDSFSRSMGVIFYGSPKTVIPNLTTRSGFEIRNTEPFFIEINAPQFDKPVQLFLIPYLNEQRLLEFLGETDTENNLRALLSSRLNDITARQSTNAYRIGVAHLLVQSKEGVLPSETEDEKPILIGNAQAFTASDFPSAWNYLALGHIHVRMSLQKKPYPINYCGSPIALSFSETEQDKYVELISFSEEKIHIEHRKLQNAKRLVQLEFESLIDLENWCIENPNVLIRARVKTQTVLIPSQTKHLLDQYKNIITPIEPINFETEKEEAIAENSVGSQDIRALFNKYYTEKNNGVAPNAAILNIFEEILSIE